VKNSPQTWQKCSIKYGASFYSSVTVVREGVIKEQICLVQHLYFKVNHRYLEDFISGRMFSAFCVSNCYHNVLFL
jgi:hypothetical protein